MGNCQVCCCASKSSKSSGTSLKSALWSHRKPLRKLSISRTATAQYGSLMLLLSDWFILLHAHSQDELHVCGTYHLLVTFHSMLCVGGIAIKSVIAVKDLSVASFTLLVIWIRGGEWGAFTGWTVITVVPVVGVDWVWQQRNSFENYVLYKPHSSIVITIITTITTKGITSCT